MKERTVSGASAAELRTKDIALVHPWIGEQA